MLLLSFYELENDNFRFKSEVREREKISWVRANSQGSIPLVGPLKVLLRVFYRLKTDNFRFKPEVRGRGKISWVRANSQSSIPLVGPLKVLFWLPSLSLVRGIWRAIHCFFASGFTRGNWWTTNCLLASQFARGNC